MENGAVIQVSNLTKQFGGVHALSGVSFDLCENEILGIIGPNGAGKTTLLNLVSGLFKPSSGSITYRGKDITQANLEAVARAKIIRTFQHIRLFNNLTVLENVSIACLANVFSENGRSMGVFHRSQNSLVIDEAKNLLRDFNLTNMENLLPNKLPYGLAKRLGIVLAVANKPDILLLDEPAAGMTREDVNALGDIIRKVQKNGVSIILVEHNMKFLMNITTRIVVLDGGRKITEGSPSEIRENAQVIKVYLGESSRRSRENGRSKH